MGESLFVVNRPGNRPGYEHAAWCLNQAIALCRTAGVKGITLRGDTGFVAARTPGPWDNQGVRFGFDIDATDKL